MHDWEKIKNETQKQFEFFFHFFFWVLGFELASFFIADEKPVSELMEKEEYPDTMVVVVSV